MTFDLKDYRFVKSHHIETQLEISDAFRCNACILQPLFDAIQEHNSGYSTDVVYDIFAIQDELQKWRNQDFTGGRTIRAMGVRKFGVDTIELNDLVDGALDGGYPGGVFVFRVEYDTERKITYLILDEYEKKEESNHAED